MAQNRKHLHSFPDGWYAVAASAELRPGGVLSRKLGGQDLVVFRTAAGAVGVLDAHCPHLGAHLGCGGRVQGESIQCPFHGLRFGTVGRCLGGAHGDAPEFRPSLRAWPVREKNGFILVHYSGAGEAPSWEVPDLELSGWTPPLTHTARVRAHPQETSENSVDLAHFSVVHGYDGVSLLDAPELDGPHLRTRYGALRRNPFLPRRLSERLTVRIEYDVDLWGLGYSLVHIRVPAFGLLLRLWVLSTHTDGEAVSLTLACSAHRRPASAAPAWSRWLPWPLLSRLLRRLVLRQVVQDVRQDTQIWANKIHLDPPALVKGDGPIGLYRRYARQFYPLERERETVPKLAS
jgi:phenylpropionate dioxygenase-like ring-hydroxylating dioxygenase large terminal subunit